MKPSVEIRESTRNDYIQQVTIAIGEENRALMIPSQRHVIEATSQMDSESARHPCLD